MLSTPQNSPPEAALRERLAALRQRLAVAAAAAGRDVDSITLLAVSKGQEAAQLRAALALGVRQFGENYVDEALAKIQALRGGAPAQAGAGAVWHFIGRVQANKTRPVADTHPAARRTASASIGTRWRTSAGAAHAPMRPRSTTAPSAYLTR